MDWTGLDRVVSNGIGTWGLGSEDWDRLALGARTDLLDNGLTKSLTHGARDFSGRQRTGGGRQGREWW